jgi:hypothetical protein
MASSFGGLTIYPDKPGSNRGLEFREGFDARHHVLYSNDNVVDFGGLGPNTYRRRVWIDAANRTAFEAKRQQSGTFILHDVSKGTARLMQATDPEQDDNSGLYISYQVEIIW